MKVLTFGEILWDIYPEDKFIGGAPLNFAAHFVKCGGNSSILSAVGKDELGDETIDAVKGLHVGTEYITKVPAQTGKCLVTLDKNSVPRYDLLSDVAYDYISYNREESEKFDVLYFGTLALRSANNLNCIKHIMKNNGFNEVFVDINIRKPFISEETLKFSLENATIIKISDEELPFVENVIKTGSSSPEIFAKKLCECYPNLKVVVVTLGSEGALAYERESGNITKCPAQKVKVSSTVGAGDSFSAAFLSMYLKNRKISDCLEFASKVSGFVVSAKGAIPDYDAKKFNE